MSSFDFNITEIKYKIRDLDNMSESDRKVLLIVDSFWACPEYYVKANLARCINQYAGCRAWNIAMRYVYM